MLMGGYLRQMKEDILETLLLIKICLTSFWFWLPIFYACYLFFQYWMLVNIHPLTIFILPAALIIYLLTQEDKRIKATYGIVEERPRRFFPLTLSGEEKPKGLEWDLAKTLGEYEEMMNKLSKEKENSTD